MAQRAEARFGWQQRVSTRLHGVCALTTALLNALKRVLIGSSGFQPACMAHAP